MWALFIAAGMCSELSLAWTPAAPQMSVAPALVPPEVVVAAPASIPADASEPLICENAFDPRCQLQPGIPSQSHTQAKHAPDLLWVVAVPAYAKAAYTVATVYVGRALAGFFARPERPPRCA